MNPGNNNNVNDPVTTEPQVPAQHPVNQITSVSKYLAMVLFILLPFIGGYVGYELGQKETASTQLSPISSPVSVEKNVEENPVVTYAQPDFEFKDEAMAAKFTKSKDTIRYVSDKTDQNFKSKIPFDYFPFYEEISGVTFLDENAAKAASLPYLFVVASTTDFIIFSKPLFKETEGFESGLYKYQVRTKTLNTMMTSERYYPAMTGGKVSPDQTKLSLVNNPYPPVDELSAAGLELGYIDLVSDMYKSLKKLDINDTARFCIQEMGCYSEFEWKSDTMIEAKITYWTKCESQTVEAKDEDQKTYKWNTCDGPALKTELISLSL